MWFRRKPVEEGLDKELRYHFEKLVRDYVAEGASLDEARRSARLEFGGVEQVKEECRDARGRWLDDFVKDLRYTMRTLRRSPAFAAVAVVSLALGIGANTAIFDLINAVMLHTLPVKEPERLVQIARLRSEGKPAQVSFPLFQTFRDNMKSTSAAAIATSSTAAILIDGVEEVVELELVSGDHYAMLGVEPAAGRLLEASDDAVSPVAPAAVLSFRYWQRRFGGNPSAIGKTLTVQNKTFTVVGVTPPRFTGTRPGRDPDITLPLTMNVSESTRREDTNNNFIMLGRLAPGATVEQADAEMQVLWTRFKQRVAASEPEKDRPRILAWRAAVVRAADGFNPLRHDYSQALFILMGMVGLLLLLACANVSGLLLARASSRQREIAIRLAIGAGRGRLMRQFLTESFVLAMLGGGAGLLMAPYLSATLVTTLANGGTLLLSTSPDWRVLAFTAAVSLAACMFGGVAPGVHAIRASLQTGLKQSRTSGQRAGKALVIAQVAISMMLLTGASLFVGTLVKLYRVDRGMRTEQVLTFSVRARERYSQTRSWAVQSAVLDRLRSAPNVAVASATAVLPLSGSEWGRRVLVEGHTYGPKEDEGAAFNAVAPRYFEAIGTPLVAGRDFDERDTMASKKVAIVNESFARSFFGARSPLGYRVTSVDITYEIVAVVKDAKYQSLRQEVVRTMYIPWMQRDGQQPMSFNYLVRVDGGNPMQLVPALDKLLRDADPALRLRAAQTYSTVIDRSIVTERIMATLGGFFGVLALIVACVGIFGVLAFQVSRRVNEIGVRMALGARRSGIIALVLREVVMILAAGCAIGTAGALMLTGLTRKMLFGVTPGDPIVFLTAAAMLTVAALLAGWLPARRASKIDPMIALRHD
jgi:predicted permease